MGNKATVSAPAFNEAEYEQKLLPTARHPDPVGHKQDAIRWSLMKFVDPTRRLKLEILLKTS